MATLANIKALPGLYGGGFARVVQVDTLIGNTSSAVNQEALRLEKLKDPLSSFRQSLAQYTTSTPTKTAQQPVSFDSQSLTLLQSVDAQASSQTSSQSAALAQQASPAEQATDTGSSEAATYADELALAEQRREQQKAEDARKAEAHAQALREFEQAEKQRQNAAQAYLEQLTQSLQATQDTAAQTNTSGLSYSDVGSNNYSASTASASLAAQTYANAVAAANS